MSFFKKFNNLDTKRNFVSLRANRFLKLGQDIDAEAENDYFGASVSMNATGNIVAIGAYKNDATLRFGVPDAGHVRIYSWNGTGWEQLGQDIDGEFGQERSGFSVSMNAAGNRVVIGSPYHVSNSGQVRVYEWSGTVWTQLGQDINGSGFFGWSVSMNNDGNRIAVSAYLYDSNVTDAGQVRVYEFNGATWIQLGTDILGTSAQYKLGYSVSMNSIGNRVAIGAISVNKVQIYEWNGTIWTQLGTDINGEAADDQFGFSVSMNAAGDRVAIGAPYNDVGGAKIDGGHVRVYSWNGTAWTQLGVDIDAEAAGDLFGYTVSMNAAGDRVAIGAPNNDANGAKIDGGHVRVYSLNGTAWTQLGADIDAEAAGDLLVSVSMNAAGDRVAIGAPNNDANGAKIDGGHVRVYKDCMYYAKIDIWIKKVEMVFPDMAISSSGGVIWGINNSLGGQKDMWTSVDYGNNWSVNSFSSPRPAYSIAMSSNGVVRAYVTYGGKIYVSINSGANWTARESDRAWYSIAMSSTGAIQTAVEYGGQIYVSTNSGTNWTARDSARSWEAVAMSSNGVIQTAVDYFGRIYVSTNSGTNWAGRESNRNWKAVAMSSDGVIQTAVVYNGQIYVSTDSGNTWTAKESIRNWQDVAMSSDGIIQTAVAENGEIYVSSDSGNTWKAKQSIRSWSKVVMTSNGLIQLAQGDDGLYVSM